MVEEPVVWWEECNVSLPTDSKY